uniref:Nonstructural protein n=1 Tax=Parvoviridae sp. TaxID=1940570 RepID=A0A7D3QJY5_9VIRU|nr:MAG: nonstructural protein [Parvoviridae sp.]QKE54956.1 MAG: nonstructural protein [Parvoviridae sp.]
MSSETDSDCSWTYVEEDEEDKDGPNQEQSLAFYERRRRELSKDEQQIYQFVQEILGEHRRDTAGVVEGRRDLQQERRCVRGGSGEVRGIGLYDEGGVRQDTVTESELRKVLTTEFRRSNLRHRIVHSVYERKLFRGETIENFTRHLQRAFHGSIFIIGEHGNHYHVVHDCNWSSSTCRCSRIRGIEFDSEHGRSRFRYNRKITSTAAWDIDHWINLLIYLSTAERRLNYVEISGKCWLRDHRGKSSTLFQGGSFRLERSLESVRLSDENCSAKQLGPHSYPGDEIDQEHYGTAETSGRFQEDSVSEAGSSTSFGSRFGRGATAAQKEKKSLFQYLQGVIFSPPKALFASRLWLKSNFRYTDRRKNYFQVTFEELKLFYVERSISDIWAHVLDIDSTKIFYASENKDEYYYGMRDSVKYLEALLFFQFHTADRVRTFLLNLKCILDKERPKVNTLFIYGAPNAGKNFFFDAVAHYCVNFGIISNWTKYNAFPLQDCVNRRLLMWNEPNFEDGVEETLKMLFGGDQCGARIKYEGDGIIQRTPIIVLSNEDPFPTNVAFRTRMIKYTWQPCKHLRKLKKKPFPLAIAYLLARWEIIDYKSLSYEFSDDELCIFNDESLDSASESEVDEEGYDTVF